MVEPTPNLSPLIEALANNRAVAFVGSGIAASCNVPTWRDLLVNCVQLARTGERESRGLGGLDIVQRALDNYDYPLAAELLGHRINEKTLSEYLKRIIRPHESSGVSDLYTAIARLPFSVLITTNYDDLLERAHNGALTRYTWKDADEIIRCIQEGRSPAIIKVHGHLDDFSSIVFTKSAYSAIIYRQPLFAQCLRLIFSLKTVLFLGCGLRDPDLQHAMLSAKASIGQNFGPHFAFLPADEADSVYARHLYEEYRITAVPCELGQETRNRWGTYYRNLAGSLRDLHGKCLEAARAQSVQSGSVPLSRVERVQAVLTECVRATGATRGDVCFVQDHINQQILCTTSYPNQHGLPKPVDPMSVMATTFLRRRYPRDFIYIPDVEDWQRALQEMGFPDTVYEERDPRIKSELALPILSDGRRVGVLNLEAAVKDWFSDEHISYLQFVADTLGWVFYAAARRQDLSDRLLPMFRDPQKLKDVLEISRAVRGAGIGFILYWVNYLAGTFEASSPQLQPGEKFVFGFSEVSLPGEILRTRELVEIEDALKELERDQPRLNERGIQKFQISGRVLAEPVRVAGSIAAVLVLWNRRSEKSGRSGQVLFDSASKRIRRIFSLLANDASANLSDAMAFLKNLDKRLSAFDEATVRSPRKLAQSGLTREFIRELMICLTEEPCGLGRVRLWVCDGPWNPRHAVAKPDTCVQFRCMMSHSSSRANPSSFGDLNDIYVDVVSLPSDRYTRYTLLRYMHDPYARWQHPTMFGVPDTNCDVLHKDPDGSWLVAPLVFNMQLFGFVSADNHLRESASGPSKDQKPPESKTLFQLQALDLVADVLNGIGRAINEELRPTKRAPSANR